jgi:hypothetical protein
VLSQQIPKLGVVAATYLANLDEMEAARDAFLGERKEMLQRIGAIMSSAATDAKQVVAAQRIDESQGTLDIDIAGEYVALRTKQGKKRSSGYSAQIGSTLGHVGAQTLLWFHLKLNPQRQKRFDLAGLISLLGAGAEVKGEGMWLYIRTAAFPATNLDVDALAEQAQRLPALFAIADPWIAKGYEGLTTA